ncbi:hypothetical protein FB45DRAFT_873929 [Roridomyces roridus]|uniref:Nephrocystin 3-like N-terminal domain-containing protein n=1 Tax=Roridomyces roridus TaxID=1738132 RepID=A0AAD7B915_9AGAR|nr:hypothetical protein FB45DRAFT_873929 [Roridomyces roridus]
MLRLEGDRPVRLQNQGPGNIVRIEGDRPVQFQNSGTFNNVAGSMHVSHTTNVGEYGLDILFRAMSPDAIHDSAERPPDPSCHPGTRRAILDQLDKWSFEQPSDSLILWVHGCAGIGKSAIAQQFAASCHDRGQLGGSFFFKRGSASCGTWRNVLPTLVYQLTVAFPQLGPMIQRAVDTDRRVLGKAMHHQLEQLLVKPFRETPPLRSRPILVIDGLDECEDRGAQTTLMRALIDILRSGNATLHILDCSRSEPHLREVFEATENSDVCQGLEIQTDASALTDIRRYLTEEFSRIHQLHTCRGMLLEADWPGEDTIDHLVRKSSGTFIYASTVLRYVDDEYSHPAEQLDAVLSLDPASLTPLDDLYTQILAAVPNKRTLLRVVHAVLETELDPEVIDGALQMRRGTSRAILRGLHAVVRVHPVRILRSQQPVELLHASFEDFLVDSHRSSSFCVSGEGGLETLVHDMARALSSGSLEPYDFQSITSAFVQRFPKIPPSDKLLPVFWNVNFQHEVYNHYWPWSSKDQAQTVITWLETSNSESPRDYPTKISHPEYLQSPDLLSVLRIWDVLPRFSFRHDILLVLDLLALKWNVLLPLTKVSGTDSVDIVAIQEFLNDPEKSGALFMPRKEIMHFAALRSIRHLKEAVLQPNYIPQFKLQAWISLLFRYQPDAELLDALKDVNLAQACSRLELDAQYHLACHEGGHVQPRWFAIILKWIRKAPSPPPELLRSWEQQKKAVKECYARLPSEMYPDDPPEVDYDSDLDIYFDDHLDED